MKNNTDSAKFDDIDLQYTLNESSVFEQILTVTSIPIHPSRRKIQETHCYQKERSSLPANISPSQKYLINTIGYRSKL